MRLKVILMIKVKRKVLVSLEGFEIIFKTGFLDPDNIKIFT